jgi:hypothetical protein
VLLFEKIKDQLLLFHLPAIFCHLLLPISLVRNQIYSQYRKLGAFPYFRHSVLMHLCVLRIFLLLFVLSLIFDGLDFQKFTFYSYLYARLCAFGNYPNFAYILRIISAIIINTRLLHLMLSHILSFQFSFFLIHNDEVFHILFLFHPIFFFCIYI